MSDSLFEVPLYFISEYLNGWVIVILIIIIIYFVALRNYYQKKEQFFDQSMQLKEINEIEDIEEQINNETNHESNDESNDESTTKPLITKSTIKTKKYNIIKSQNNQNKVKLKGNDIFEKFEVMSTTSASLTDKGFNGASAPLAKALVSTTLFNNLNLNAAQTSSCLMNYNEVINKYIIDLKKLNDLKNKNEYLNVKKQFDGIISKGIDNIVNYLNNVIKSPNILTRTSIRIDVINTLSTNIENLINKANNDLSIEINKLAILNSTTIDYKNMMNLINDSRSKIENYIELDKLVSKYGRNISNYNRNINDVINKSNLLPIYESNFDKINQLLKSDYNDDETKLSTKYGKAYTDYLSEMKKEDLDVNPMRLASQIESGIVNMLSNLSGSGNKNSSKYEKENNGEDNEDIIEQYNREYGYTQNNSNNKNKNNINNKSNVIPSQQSNLVNNTNLNENANIYNDRGNIGSYLIDKKTQKQVLEGFVDITTTAPNTTRPNTTYSNTNNESESERRNPLSPYYNGLINIDTINASSNMTIGGWNIGSTGIFGNNNIEPDTTKQNTTNTNTTKPNTTNPSTSKGARESSVQRAEPSRGAEALVTDYVKNKKHSNNKDIISSLLSGEFLQYVMDIMNDKLNMIYGMYNTKFNNDDNGYDKNGNKSNDSKTLYGNFKLEENMIPAGFLLFILSMLVYFVDTTS